MTATERTTWEIAIEGANTINSINQLIRIAREQEHAKAAVLAIQRGQVPAVRIEF